MWTLFQRSIDDYHQYDSVDQPMKNPYPKESLAGLLYQKNWIDTVQWHLEDLIREPSIAPDKALSLKRRIDKSNQQRTDLVERIDEVLLEKFQSPAPQENARINTESPAWAVDRLSILALKVHHMAIEAERPEAEKEKRQKNQNKLEILRIQQKDLSLAIDQLLEDLASGKRIAKVYRQMKMYNDPELNPVLYQNKS